MNKTEISLEALENALSAAGESHHDYELNKLSGVRDENWAGWYSAYVLGRLGDFVSPTTLTNWLEEAPNDGNWSALTSKYVLSKLSSK